MVQPGAHPVLPPAPEPPSPVTPPLAFAPPTAAIPPAFALPPLAVEPPATAIPPACALPPLAFTPPAAAIPPACALPPPAPPALVVPLPAPPVPVLVVCPPVSSWPIGTCSVRQPAGSVANVPPTRITRIAGVEADFIMVRLLVMSVRFPAGHNFVALFLGVGEFLACGANTLGQR